MKTANANARLVSASSWPFLSFGAGIDTTHGMTKIHMKVLNAGVGPAKIESAELIWKGVGYARDQDFLAPCCGFDPLSKTGFDSDLLPQRSAARGRANRISRVYGIRQPDDFRCAATSNA
jgi:hypothetical protein